MRVVFVEPTGAHANVFAEFMNIPLLGPLYLGTIAEKAGYDVSILNENILKRKVTDSELSSADVLCVSCITTTVNRGKEIAKRYKALNPNGRTIIGGIHASMIPEDVAPYFDQVIVGEAEDSILDVLAGRTTDKIVTCNTPQDLDKHPIPNFRLLKGWQKIDIWPVMTSRGCPYDCNFCSVTQMFGRCYRSQSPERVMEEIVRYKKGTVFFSDDHFVADKGRTWKLMELMKKSSFDRRWNAQVRTEITKDPKYVAKMRDAGCSTVYIGFESVNPDTLEKMNKKQSVADIRRSIKVFHDNGIKIHGMFILGEDSDTKKTFRMTSDFCSDTGVDFAQYSVLTPFPGTRTYHKLEKEGRLLHKNWDFYDGLHAVFKPKNMTAAELQQGMISCFSDFYSYGNAINDALNAVAKSAITSVKKMYANAHFPSYYPAVMRFVGKGIVKDWVKHNKSYLKYVKWVSDSKNSLTFSNNV